jgi:hypothetical protein
MRKTFKNAFATLAKWRVVMTAGWRCNTVPTAKASCRRRKILRSAAGSGQLRLALEVTSLA